MSGHISGRSTPEVEVLTTERRRRWSLSEKQRMVEESLQPGMSASEVSRRHGVSPSLLFRWRKLAAAGALKAVGADGAVVPETELKAMNRKVRDLQRILGKKTEELEILKEALEIARGNGWLVRSP